MATRIYVLCRSDAAISNAELAGYMAHMGFLDEPATFVPPLDQMGDPAWRSFELHYRADKRPIIVRQRITSAEMMPALSDLMEDIDDARESAAAEDVRARLGDLKRMFVFEVPDDLPQDVWEMLDATEAFLAREHNGVVISDEGVFDAELNQIVTFSE